MKHNFPWNIITVLIFSFQMFLGNLVCMSCLILYSWRLSKHVRIFIYFFSLFIYLLFYHTYGPTLCLYYYMKTAATVSPRRHTRAHRGIPHMMPCGAIHAKVAIETFVFKKKKGKNKRGKVCFLSFKFSI